MFLLLFVALLSAEKKVFSVEEQERIETPTTIVASPSGNKFAYSTAKFDKTTGYSLRFYVSDGAKAGTKEVTIPYHSFHDLVWTAEEDVISFLTEKAEKTVVVVMNIETKDVKELLTLPVAAKVLKWSPKGGYFAFTASVYFQKSLEETAAEDLRRSKLHSNPRIWDTTPVSTPVSYHDAKLNHIFVVATTKTAAATKYDVSGDPVDVMAKRESDGAVALLPTEGFAFSYDDHYFSYTSFSGKNTALECDQQIFLHDLTDHTEEQLTSGSRLHLSPFFEPKEDGTKLLFLTSMSENHPTDLCDITIYDTATKMTRLLTDSYHFRITEPKWSPLRPNTIVTSVRREAKSVLVLFDTVTGSELAFTSPHSISRFVLLSHNRYAYIRSTMATPPEVYVYDGSAAPAETQLTSFAEPVLSECYPLIPPQEIWYDNKDGERIHSYFLPPLHLHPSEETLTGFTTQRSPMVVNVHGGPESATLDEWNILWNPEIYAHQGYAVFSPNAHGSDSFGKLYADSVRKNWGSTTPHDIITGVAHVMSHFSYIDPSRLAAMGPSYGGFMMNWLCATTRCFSVFVCHAGIFDNIPMYGDTDIPAFMEDEHGGLPWDKESTYSKYSPATVHSNNPSPPDTAILVTQGGIDHRVPWGQGFMAYQTYAMEGLSTRFVFFPSEPHHIMNPFNRLRFYVEVTSWLRNRI